MSKPSKSIGVKRILREVRVLREPPGSPYFGQWGVWIGYPMAAMRVERPNSRAFTIFQAKLLRRMLRGYADGKVE